MNLPELVWLDATELARLVAARQVTAVEMVQAHLDRISELGGRINAFVTGLGEQALAAAAEPPRGPLSGVPFTIKDSFDTAGVRTTRGSLLFTDHVPARDVTAVARLRAAGGIPLAKTDLPELSYCTETDNRVVGRSLNPYDPERTPGGSSGGESAAIAAGSSPLGLGSDVAISVRGPAHDAGVAILVGTDVPPTPLPFPGGMAHGANVHHELQLLVRAGLTPTETLRCATSVPARRFDLVDRTGSRSAVERTGSSSTGDLTTAISDTLYIRHLWRRGTRATG